MISEDLLNILRCPLGKSELELKDGMLVCKRCGPKFPIKDGIPVMLIDEAELPEECASIEELPCAKEQVGDDEGQA